MQSPISWQDGVPVSDIYGDIYFSRESGLQETNYVFIEGNFLPSRWLNIKDNFHIIETGFGTGLNFFAAWKLWREMDNGMELHFTSIEKHPLSLSDIQTAISIWPEFNKFMDEFSAQYPALLQGETNMILDNGRVHLHLSWGDVNEIAGRLNKPADAWFLDGFAPAKNPDMWNNNLYKDMARLTLPGGTFATFTAVGDVRRGLQENGFIVKKVPGFGKKRHILIGVKN